MSRRLRAPRGGRRGRSDGTEPQTVRILVRHNTDRGRGQRGVPGLPRPGRCSQPARSPHLHRGRHLDTCTPSSECPARPCAQRLPTGWRHFNQAVPPDAVKTIGNGSANATAGTATAVRRRQRPAGERSENAVVARAGGSCCRSYPPGLVGSTCLPGTRAPAASGDRRKEGDLTAVGSRSTGQVGSWGRRSPAPYPYVPAALPHRGPAPGGAAWHPTVIAPTQALRRSRRRPLPTSGGGCRRQRTWRPPAPGETCLQGSPSCRPTHRRARRAGGPARPGASG